MVALRIDMKSHLIAHNNSIEKGGPDLQERKKFLVSNTDALIVMPGGPGTWDELWEMVR